MCFRIDRCLVTWTWEDGYFRGWFGFKFKWHVAGGSEFDVVPMERLSKEHTVWGDWVPVMDELSFICKDEISMGIWEAGLGVAESQSVKEKGCVLPCHSKGISCFRLVRWLMRVLLIYFSTMDDAIQVQEIMARLGCISGWRMCCPGDGWVAIIVKASKVQGPHSLEWGWYMVEVQWIHTEWRG